MSNDEALLFDAIIILGFIAIIVFMINQE